MSKQTVSDTTKATEEDIDWGRFIGWDIPACKDILLLAYIVCLAGPVHVHTQRSWPGLNGKFSIADKFKEAEYPKPITNRTWMKFCEVVSQKIDCTLNSVKQSYTYKKYGKLWPGCADKLILDDLSEAIKKTERSAGALVNRNI